MSERIPYSGYKRSCAESLSSSGRMLLVFIDKQHIMIYGQRRELRLVCMYDEVTNSLLSARNVGAPVCSRNEQASQAACDHDPRRAVRHDEMKRCGKHSETSGSDRQVLESVVKLSEWRWRVGACVLGDK